jgi:hypothetical protein
MAAAMAPDSPQRNSGIAGEHHEELMSPTTMVACS